MLAQLLDSNLEALHREGPAKRHFSHLKKSCPEGFCNTGTCHDWCYDIQTKCDTCFDIFQLIYSNLVILYYIVIIQPIIFRVTSDIIIRVFKDIPRQPIQILVIPVEMEDPFKRQGQNFFSFLSHRTERLCDGHHTSTFLL